MQILQFKSNAGTFGIANVSSRVLFSLFIVFATYNPSGRSFYHWVVDDGSLWPRIFVGLVLFGVYAALLYATWEVIGVFGFFLAIVICLAFAEVLEQMNLIDLADPITLQLVILFTLAATMGWGMSYAMIIARLTGILHARTTVH